MMLGGAAGGGGSYWMLVLGDGASWTYSPAAQCAAFRSNGNLNVACTTRAGAVPNMGAGIFEITPEGDVVEEIEYHSGASSITYGWSIVLDDADNLYWCGLTTVSSSNKTWIQKLNSSYVKQWEGRYTYSTSANQSVNLALAADGLDLYVVPTVSVGPIGSRTNTVAARLNVSTGAVSFDTAYGDAAYNNSQLGVRVTSTDRIFIACSQAGASPAYRLVVSEWDDSCAIVNERKLTGTNALYGYCLAMSPDETKLFLGGYDSTTTDAIIVGYDITSGIAWSWDRQLSDASETVQTNAACCDASNVYLLCNAGSPSSANYDMVVACYSHAGSLQWKLRISYSGGTQLSASDIVYDGNGALYIIFEGPTTGSQDRLMICKLPDDGSITGTFGAWTIATDVDLTDSAVTLTDAAETLTSAAITLTNTPTTQTLAAVSHTISLEPIA